jgi:tetratricopeptide (TPR) repeat protein
MAIDINKTKGNVFGVGVGGDKNFIGNEIHGNVIHIHLNSNSENMEIVKQIASDSSSAYQINHQVDLNNNSRIENTQTLHNNINGLIELMNTAEAQKGTQIDKVVTGNFSISRNELEIKNLVTQGVISFFSGNPYGAMQFFDRAIAINPNFELAWYDKGNVYAYTGNIQQALFCFDRAIAINPNFDVAWNDKGIILTSMGMVNDANRCFDRAIEINPYFHYPWYNKGILFANLGNLQASLQCYDNAIRIAPNYAPAYYNKSIVLQTLGRYPEANDCLMRARYLGLPV